MPVSPIGADMPLRRLRVLDTTLRDGDQAAGYAFTPEQKLKIALALEKAGVDCVEAGFPSSSKREADVCRLIAAELATASVAVMSRSVIDDIRLSASVLGGGDRGLLHLSLPVSSHHIRTKFRRSEAEMLILAADCTAFASGLASGVEVGAEDATRADRNFLLEYCCAVTEAGADIVNIADTVGHAVPQEFAGLIRFLLERVPAFRTGQSLLSVHCHNDFGLANANTLAGISAGCGQIEVTCLGIGERSGNAALEEVAAVLECRKDSYHAETGLDPAETERLIALVSNAVPGGLSPLKPVTGWNRRSHASGIHQKSTLEHGPSYSPLSPELSTAGDTDRIVIGPHSGRAGLRAAISQYAGLEVDETVLTDLLRVIKTDARSIPLLAVSDLLSILYTSGLIEMAPLSCQTLSVVEDSSTTGTLYSVTARVSGLMSPLSAHAASWPAALCALLVPTFSPGIRIAGFAFSACSGGDPSLMGHADPVASVRLTLDATVDRIGGRRYRLERVGTSQYRLFFDLLLDILNAERCLSACLYSADLRKLTLSAP